MEFDALIETWVDQALASGHKDFGAIVAALPGVYPADVLRAIERLRAKTTSGRVLLTRGHLERCITQPDLDGRDQPILPVPHPLDFEWRFANEAVDVLLAECARRLQRDEWTALIGASSLVLAASRRLRLERIITIDANREMLEFVQRQYPAVVGMGVDVMRDPAPDSKVKVVVLDPPWYPEVMRGFLWVASEMCSLGGSILLSIPPIGTRPGILAERHEFFKWAVSAGLEVEKVQTGILPYASPPFERSALMARGIQNIPITWRRGDLVILSKVGLNQAARTISKSEGCPPWVEERLGRVRIRVRVRPESGFRDPVLLKMVDNDVLDSVSRRDPRRAQVDVWTSGNRVFRCMGTEVLRRILACMRQGLVETEVLAAHLGRHLSSDEKAKVESTRVKVEGLVSLEEYEHSYYADPFSQEECGP